MTKRDAKLEEAFGLIEAACQAGDVTAAVLLVQRRDFSLIRSFGKDGHRRAVFLLASVSKPLTATGVMVLVDRGEIRLDDPVRRYLPEFTGGGRDQVTLRHLLTHTSGLPDMLPENIDLRKRHASQQEFVAAICRTPLLFTPGTAVRYQSTGSLIAARIAESITGTPFRDFLQQEVFTPLGMVQTSLGLGSRTLADVVRCRTSGHDEWNRSDGDDWNWNSAYWRNFGAPWGGVHSTAEDLGRILDDFLYPSGRVLKPETVAKMIVNQTGLSEPWGLGWAVKPGTFGLACSSQTFGHYGVSGTIAWSDPKANLSCVLLTNKQIADSRDGLPGQVSDLVAEWGA
jgi:CubicO group peptidase (beta-lactamase class C family)